MALPHAIEENVANILPSGRCRTGGADGIREAPQPIRSGRKDDVANSFGEGISSRRIGIPEGSVPHHGFYSAPFIPCGEARVQFAMRFAAVRAVPPFLGQDCSAPKDSRTGGATFCGDPVLNGLYPFSDKGGKLGC